MIYLVAFSLSAALIYLSSRARGALEVMLVVSGLAIPCFLAGMRDETVGVDVLSYAKWMCINAQSLPFAEFMRVEAPIAATGWNVFTWVSVRLFGGLPGYLSAIEALCIVPVYFALRRVSRRGAWVGLLIWLFLEFPFSLNGMRQSVAMAFVFYAATFVLERRPLPYLCWIAIGLLFHQTAVMGLLFYPLALVVLYSEAVRSFLGKWKAWWLLVGGVLVFCLLLLFGGHIVVALSFLKDSYQFQVSRLGENDWSIAGFYLLAMVSFIWFISRRDFCNVRNSELCESGRQSRLSERGEEGLIMTYGTSFTLLCILIAVGAALWQLNHVAATLGRLGYYGTMLIALLGGVLNENGRRSSGHLFCLIVLSLIYFVAMTLILHMSGAYPYTSQILGIG